MGSPSWFLRYEQLKPKNGVFLQGFPVTTVTFQVTKMTESFSVIIGGEKKTLTPSPWPTPTDYSVIAPVLLHLNEVLKEHLRNTKTAAKGSRIANHAWSNNHAIDFENMSIVDKGTFRPRKTLEAWHTRVTPNADNNSCPLPGQYNILFNKHS